MPRSSKKARIWLMMPVRWLTGRARAMQRLQVQLIGCFGGDELHGWALDSFSDCFSIAEIVLLPFALRFDVLRWHEPRIVAKRMQPAAEVMGSDASLHADQARGMLASGILATVTNEHLRGLAHTTRLPALGLSLHSLRLTPSFGARLDRGELLSDKQPEAVARAVSVRHQLLEPHKSVVVQGAH
jgi:hypothetical protein